MGYGVRDKGVRRPLNAQAKKKDTIACIPCLARIFFFLNEGRDTKYPFEGIITAARGTRYWVLGTEY